MTRLGAATAAFLALAVVVSAQGLQRPRFVPPRLKTSELPVLPPLPAPTVIGGGEVLIEALVDRRGTVLRPAIVRATPPYTQFVLDAVARWQFEPARDIDVKGLETLVDMPITVAAIYRAPVLMNTPTIGEPAREWSKPSGEAAYPTVTSVPNYPPQAFDGGVVLFEVSLNEEGVVVDTRGIGSAAGFESASREALAGWRFRGGLYRARPVPATAYVLFGFRPPIGLDPPCVTDDERPKCKCRPNDLRPECRVPVSPGARLVPPPFGVSSFR